MESSIYFILDKLEVVLDELKYVYDLRFGKDMKDWVNRLLKMKIIISRIVS